MNRSPIELVTARAGLRGVGFLPDRPAATANPSPRSLVYSAEIRLLISDFPMDSDGSSRPLEPLLHSAFPLRSPSNRALKSPALKSPQNLASASVLKSASKSNDPPSPVLLSRPAMLTEPPSAVWARCLGTTIALLTLTLPWMAVVYSNWDAMPSTALPTPAVFRAEQPMP